jgi:beta-lactamase class A
MIKVPILIGTFDAVEKGKLRVDQPLIYTDSLLYEGHDLIGALEDSATVPLAKLALLMITTSDNTASLWLQGLVGGAAINEWPSRNFRLGCKPLAQARQRR